MNKLALLVAPLAPVFTFFALIPWPVLWPLTLLLKMLSRDLVMRLVTVMLTLNGWLLFLLRIVLT
jgi:hypothetical protein